MLEACGQLMSFLNQAGMVKSLKAFQDDMGMHLVNIFKTHLKRLKVTNKTQFVDFMIRDICKKSKDNRI